MLDFSCATSEKRALSMLNIPLKISSNVCLGRGQSRGQISLHVYIVRPALYQLDKT